MRCCCLYATSLDATEKCPADSPLKAGIEVHAENTTFLQGAAGSMDQEELQSYLVSIAETLKEAKSENNRLHKQILFERGLVAEATGASFYPPECKTDLDVVLSQVMFMRDNQAKVTLQRDRLQALLHEVINQYYLSRTADHMTEATSLDIAAQIATKVEEIMK